MNRRILAGCVVMALSLAGCAARRTAVSTFKDPNMDFSLIRAVAVVPFSNLSPSARASERVRDVFMTMLQATGSLYVVPPGEVARAITRVGITDPTAPTTEQLVALAKNLDADVVITGTVLEYGEVRSGSATANVISLSLEMLEGQTGRMVWSSSSTQGGVGAAKRLFGGGGEPMNVVTMRAVEDLINALFR